MKIYFAALAPPDLLKLTGTVLFSYYDLEIRKMRFRNVTFNTIIDENKEIKITGSSGNS